MQQAHEVLSDRVKRRAFDEGAELPPVAPRNKDDDKASALSLREEIERKYYPERHAFWPFGDPLKARRERAEKLRREREDWEASMKM